MKFRRFTSRVVAIALIGSLLAGVALVAGPVAPAEARGLNDWGKYFQDDNEIFSDQSQWMSELPDSLMIGDLSIPATHDSMSHTGGAGAQTQQFTIEDQLTAGIRGFDLRWQCRIDDGEPVLRIYHGGISQYRDLSEVFDVFQTFLAAHPREFILMHQQIEKDATNECDDWDPQVDEAVDNTYGIDRNKEFTTLTDSYGNLFYKDPDGDGIASDLETAQGSDPNNSDTDGDGLGDGDEKFFFKTTVGTSESTSTTDAEATAGGDPAKQNYKEDIDGDGQPDSGWDGDTHKKGADLKAPYLGGMRGHVVDDSFSTIDRINQHGAGYQDGFWKVCWTQLGPANCVYTVERKKEIDREFAEKANNSGTRNELWVNEIVGSSGITPKDAAHGRLYDGTGDEQDDVGLNESFLSFMLNTGNAYRRVGATYMDFPGAGLIDQIIHVNAKYGHFRDDAVTDANGPRTYDPIEIGVLKDQSCGNGHSGLPNNENLRLRFDNEDFTGDDDYNDNVQEGWTGASRSRLGSDPNNSYLEFCRVDGTNFQAPPSGMYSVLRLSNSCPADANPITRTIDTADAYNSYGDDNNDRRGGDVLPSGAYKGTSVRLDLCLFNAADRDTGDPTPFPDLGFGYGVFSNYDLGVPVLARGRMYMDDENNENSNAAIRPFGGTAPLAPLGGPPWVGHVDGTRNTNFYFSKVRGAGVQLTTDPAVPATGRVSVEADELQSLTVTVKDEFGNRLNQGNMRFTSDGGVDQQVQVVNGDAVFALNSLPVGDHDAAFAFVDDVGNYSAASGVLPVTITPDPDKPQITFINPVHGSVKGASGWATACTASGAPTTSGVGVCGTIISADPLTDVTISVQDSTGKWFDGSGFSAMAQAPNPSVPTDDLGNGTTRFLLPLPASALSSGGSYLVYVNAYEAANSVQQRSRFTFDAVGPVITPTVPQVNQVSTPAEFDDACVSDGFCGVVRDANSSVAYVKSKLAGASLASPIEQFANLGAKSWNGERTWKVGIQTSSLTPGTYTVELTSADGVGNISTLTRTFKLDAAAPTVTINAPAADALLGRVDQWPRGCTDSSIASFAGRFCLTAGDNVGVDKVYAGLKNEFGDYYDFGTNAFDFNASSKSMTGARRTQIGGNFTGNKVLTFQGPDLTFESGRYTLDVEVLDQAGLSKKTSRTVLVDGGSPQTIIDVLPDIEGEGYNQTTGYYLGDVHLDVHAIDVSPTTCTEPEATFIPAEDYQGNSNVWTGAEDSLEVTVTASCADPFGRANGITQRFAIDRTPPVVTVQPDAQNQPNANGWYKHFAGYFVIRGTDNLGQPVTNCHVDTSVAIANSPGQRLVTVGCDDVAGNRGTATYILRQDEALPVLTAGLVPAQANGANGWYSAAPSGEVLTKSDTISGIDSCDPQTAYAGADGVGLSITLTCTDKAGNVGSAVTPSFKLDRVAPVVTVGLSAVDGSNGWYKTNPTVTASGTDATSLVASCLPPYAWGGGDGQGLTAAGTCTDNAGLVGAALSAAFKVDTVKPSVTVQPTTAANGTNGWYRTAPTLRTTGADATSGVATCSSDAPWTGGDTAGSTAGGSCTDKAGNTGTATSASFKVDSTAPTVACPSSSPTYFLKQAVTMTPNVSDATSGVVTPSATSVDTSRLGVFSLALSGADKAGNTKSISCGYTVTYKIDVSGPGISPTVRPGQGAAFLVKLLDGTGKNVSARNITLTPTSGVNRNEKFNWAGSGYRLTHRTSVTPGTYTITFTVSGDPTPHSFQYTTKYGR